MKRKYDLVFHENHLLLIHEKYQPSFLLKMMNSGIFTLRVSSVFLSALMKKGLLGVFNTQLCFLRTFYMPLDLSEIYVYIDSTLLHTDSINCIKTIFFPFSFKFPKGKVTGNRLRAKKGPAPPPPPPPPREFCRHILS